MLPRLLIAPNSVRVGSSIDNVRAKVSQRQSAYRASCVCLVASPRAALLVHQRLNRRPTNEHRYVAKRETPREFVGRI